MHTEDEWEALEIALYDSDYAWLNTQAQREGMTLDAFVGRLLDDLYAAGRPYPPVNVNRRPKDNTVLRQLVQDATAVLGDQVTLDARARAYDTARGLGGPRWVLVFQTAYVTELRRLLQPQ